MGRNLSISGDDRRALAQRADEWLRTHLRSELQITWELIRDLRNGIEKTHCIRGHLLTGDNLIGKSESRQCRECRKIHQKTYRESHK